MPVMADAQSNASVPLDKAYRLLNHGPTVLVSASHDGQTNVMAAAWSCPLDFSPPKVTVVLDKATFTRSLVEQSGRFVLNVPCRAQAKMTLELGTASAHSAPDKLAQSGVKFLEGIDSIQPLVQGCVGWLVCRVIPESYIQTTYDLFIGEVIAAYADPRVFSQGRWNFEAQSSDLRTLHYVAGGQFYVTGESLSV